MNCSWTCAFTLTAITSGYAYKCHSLQGRCNNLLGDYRWKSSFEYSWPFGIQTEDARRPKNIRRFGFVWFLSRFRKCGIRSDIGWPQDRLGPWYGALIYWFEPHTKEAERIVFLFQIRFWTVDHAIDRTVYTRNTPSNAVEYSTRTNAAIKNRKKIIKITRCWSASALFIKII